MECGAMLVAPVKLTKVVRQPAGWEGSDLNGAIARWTPTEYLGSASRIPRFIAWVIDCILIGSVSWATTLVTGPMFEVRTRDGVAAWPEVEANSLALAVAGVIQAAYFIVFPATKWQATPGKKFLALRVTDANGDGIGLIQSAWRYVCQVFVLGIFIPIAMIASGVLGPYGPVPVLVALVLVLNANNKQSPWDMLAGTRVLE
jgi:uncharacterized RDD family membrane protein YckC